LSASILVSLLACAGVAAGQIAESQPDKYVGTPVQQRLEELITLIEGPNLPAAARRTAARELLRQGWPQTPPRLALVLSSDRGPARVAVAQALADLPEFLEPVYVEPLVAMLGDADGEARQSAAAALGGYRDAAVLQGLRELALDPNASPVLRLGAIEALGAMDQRDAAAALVDAIRSDDTRIRQSALEALERVTAMSFQGDPARAIAWWQEREVASAQQWQQEQIERLARRTRQLTRRLHELESRLVEAFRAEYLRTPEAERGALLQRYLKDESARVRLLGLELVQSQLGEGKSLPAEMAGLIGDQVRELLADGEAAVREAAAQTVARFRDPADAERFVSKLSTERFPQVRRAIINGLGYLGDEQVVATLLEILQEADNPCQTEAVAALGRLAERGVLSAQARSAIAEQLLQFYGRTPPGQVALRERLLWSMSLVGDPRFGEIYVAALSDSEPPLIRQAAARGIAASKYRPAVDALIPVTRDADLSVRKAAVRALAEAAATDEQLSALWERLAVTQEPDDSIRQTAWEGALRVLSARSVAEVEQWIARLPNGDEHVDRRARELLESLESSLAKVPEGLAELGRVWARFASRRAAQGRNASAVAAYCAAVRNLCAAQAADALTVAQELLRIAVLNQLWDEKVSAALGSAGPALDGAALWDSLKRELETRLTSEQAGQIVVVLRALRANPPAIFSPAVLSEIDALLRRARALAESGSPQSAPSGEANP